MNTEYIFKNMSIYIELLFLYRVLLHHKWCKYCAVLSKQFMFISTNWEPINIIYVVNQQHATNKFQFKLHLTWISPAWHIYHTKNIMIRHTVFNFGPFVPWFDDGVKQVKWVKILSHPKSLWSHSLIILFTPWDIIARFSRIYLTR